MTPTAFIFDLDGVLTDTAQYHFLAWKQIAQQLGIYFDEVDNESLKGVDRRASLQWILDKEQLELKQSEFNILLERKNRHYLTLIGNIGPAELFEGVGELFEELRQRNILVGLASASKNALQVVKRLGIAQEFDYIADSNFIVNNKPAPEIFLTVADALNQSPQQCVGIEDAVAGIQAINSANMFAVGIGSQHELTQAKIVFAEIKQFDLEMVLSTSSPNDNPGLAQDLAVD